MKNADMPALTYSGLHEYIVSKGNSPALGAMIGRSAGVAEVSDAAGPFIKFTLDGQLIARISPEHVQFMCGAPASPGGWRFPGRRWIAQIAADNKLATSVSVVGGVLCLDGNDQRPVHGRAYVVGSWGNKRPAGEQSRGAFGS